jgi:hypothetical protein
MKQIKIAKQTIYFITIRLSRGKPNSSDIQEMTYVVSNDMSVVILCYLDKLYFLYKTVCRLSVISSVTCIVQDN